MENRVRFKIGEIEFEAEGSAEIVERERSVFLNAILPAAVDAIVRTHGVGNATQYIEAIDKSDMLLTTEIDNNPEIDIPTKSQPIDNAKTSLSSYIKELGVLSDQDFTLIAAYFDQKFNGAQSFTSLSVKQYFVDARRSKPSNFSDLLLKLVQKGHIMDDSVAEKKKHKPYILTGAGIDYVEAYQPKDNRSERPRGARSKKLRSKQVSKYSSLSVDDLNLASYPEVRSQSPFKNRMVLLLYIILKEGKGDTFTLVDVEYLMTDVLGLPSTRGQISGIFHRNKTWFKSEEDEVNKNAYRYKLLQGAKDFAQSIIDGTEK